MITFHEIYERHSKDVYRYAFWLSGDSEDAQDITAETFARAWAGRDEIRTATVKAYLFAIARNIYLKARRHVNRQTDLPLDQSDGSPAPEQVVESKLALQQAISMIQALGASRPFSPLKALDSDTVSECIFSACSRSVKSPG